MSVMVSQITGASVDSTVCSGADQTKHQSSTPLTFVRGIHWWLGNSPHKGPVTQKTDQTDDRLTRVHNLLRTFCFDVISSISSISPTETTCERRMCSSKISQSCMSVMSRSNCGQRLSPEGVVGAPAPTGREGFTLTDSRTATRKDQGWWFYNDRCYWWLSARLLWFQCVRAISNF